jgi:hypothetical protein
LRPIFRLRFCAERREDFFDAPIGLANRFGRGGWRRDEAKTLLIGGCETRGLAQLSLPKSLKPSFGLAFAILALFTIIRLIGLYFSKVELFYDNESHGLFYWL